MARHKVPDEVALRARVFVALLTSCGALPAPPAECTPPVGTGSSYPLTAAFDGSRGLVLHSAPASVGTTALVHVRNAVGNNPANVTELYAFPVGCNGAYLGSVNAFEVPANALGGEWQTLRTTLDLGAFQGAAQLVLAVRPLYAQGQHLIDIDSFEVEAQ